MSWDTTAKKRDSTDAGGAGGVIIIYQIKILTHSIGTT
jgi:hypothetical protein